LATDRGGHVSVEIGFSPIGSRYEFQLAIICVVTTKKSSHVMLTGFARQRRVRGLSVITRIRRTREIPSRSQTDVEELAHKAFELPQKFEGCRRRFVEWDQGGACDPSRRMVHGVRDGGVKVIS
jgi:hypothetical protein